MNYQVLLYYNYTTITDPEEFAKDHLAFCKSLNLKGRILVAHEGINGTLSGTIEDTEKIYGSDEGGCPFLRYLFQNRS